MTSKLMERALRDADQTSSDDDTNVTMAMEQKMGFLLSWSQQTSQGTPPPPFSHPYEGGRDKSKWANGQLVKTGGGKEKTGALPLGGCKLPIRIASSA